MSHDSKKKSFTIALVAVFALSLTSVAFAEENTSNTGNSLTGFFKRLFNYPGKAVKETAGMTANTLNNTGEKVVSKTGENTAAVLSGNVSKTPNLVTDNVSGAANTVGQTASETVQIPVKAAQEDSTTAAPAAKS